MIIERVSSPNGFTVIPNRALEDEGLSFRARGLLAYLLSRPPGWKTDSEKLARVGREGREAVRTALNELVAARYLIRIREQDERGRWSSRARLFDERQPDLDATLDLGEQ